jgi:hypothetical protein
MKNHSLSTNGLSLSQAQSISNLCNQAARDINSKLNNINNVTKELTIGDKTYVETKGNPVPSDLMQLLDTRSRLHATQGFLMENIKAKDDLLKEIKNREFIFDLESPEYPELKEEDYLSEVSEEWGWCQLSNSEYSEYLEAEAYASHFGQFIHKGGVLDKLRNELPTIKTLEWIQIEDGKKTPLNVTIHHTIDQLGELHEELASVHRKHEQKVNYYKAKVKNLVTTENARIARHNADKTAEVTEINDKILTEYKSAREKWQSAYKKAKMEFEELRQKEISKAASLRIEIDPRFKSTVDLYLNQLN